MNLIYLDGILCLGIVSSISSMHSAFLRNERNLRHFLVVSRPNCLCELRTSFSNCVPEELAVRGESGRVLHMWTSYGNPASKLSMWSMSSSRPVPLWCSWAGEEGLGVKVKRSAEELWNILILHVLPKKRLTAGKMDFSRPGYTIAGF